ncbi:MAG: hypothetical protein CMD26_06005 [Flavobacteriales bacterium]|nr:hypothetical protein [Flavobacteriales bacterium]
MVKKILILLTATYTMLHAQQVMEEVIVHDDITRSYILYVPDSYSSLNPTPLVLNLHGYSSNAGQQMIYSNFYTLADLEGFILVHPQGTLDNQGFAYWNSGGITEVDDVGFLSSLIDTIATDYNINLDRVYSMGMSNGGFMSYTLACELSNRISAIASVTGSMIESQFLNCNSEHPMPVMQIHGTSDLIVPYEGNENIASIDNVISYWANFNQCSLDPVVSNVPDVNLLDLSQTEHYVYDSGLNGTSVELYKVIDGGHTWPGALIPLTGNNTNQDFNASQEIWNFFNKYDINGVINNTTTILDQLPNTKICLRNIDLLGRDILKSNFVLSIFNDGSVEKKNTHKLN